MPATRAKMSCKGGTSSLGPLPDSGFMRPQSRRFNAPSSTSPRCRRGHRLGLGHPAGPSPQDDELRRRDALRALSDQPRRRGGAGGISLCLPTGRYAKAQPHAAQGVPYSIGVTGCVLDRR